MKPSSLIGHTIEALTLAGAGRRPSDAVIAEFFRARHYLGASDRRFIAETAYGVIRHHRLLAARARHALGLPAAAPIDPATLIAALQGAAPDADAGAIASAIGEHWMSGGASCTEFLRGVRSGLAEESAWPLAVRHSIPDFVAEEWTRRFGTEAEALCEASNSQPPLAIRVNTLRGNVAACAESLSREGIATSAGLLSPAGLVLSRRINTGALRAFREGLFEMQDEGSQLIAPLLEARPGMAVLDACAGGGGKSLHLAALMENRGEIRALDVDRSRLENIDLRARRAGATIIHSGALRPGSAPPGQGRYDGVLIDAPCSGTGTFRRNPWLKASCTAEASHTLGGRQRELLRRYAPAVKPGGRLVYATCTLLDCENRDVVKDFLAQRPDFTLCDAAEVLRRQGVPISAEGPWLELLPHRTGTDGYFAAVMVRS